jgi:serralysin
MTNQAKVYRGTLEHALDLASYPAQGHSISYYFYGAAAESGQAGDQIPYPSAVGSTVPDPSNPTYGASGLFHSLAQADRDVITGGMANISRFASVAFNEATDASSTDIGFAGLNYTSPTNEAAWASAGKPSAGHGNAWYTTDSLVGSSAAAFGGTAGPDYPYYALIHELGHLLGLQHTFNGSPSAALAGWSVDENTARFSVMSYTVAADVLRPTYEFQLYDIASLQRLYGRNDSYHAGDDTYGFDSFLELNPGGVTNSTTTTRKPDCYGKPLFQYLGRRWPRYYRCLWSCLRRPSGGPGLYRPASGTLFQYRSFDGG